MAGPNVVVLEWLDGAAAAARRVRRDACDADALHRFRINTRRLVVYAKVLEKTCGVPVKPRKRLRRALRATGPCRDGHVEALWLNDYAQRSRIGATALAKALSPEAAPALGRRWWRKVDGALEKMRLAVESTSLKKIAVREAAEKEWRRLAGRLRRLDRTCGQSALHAARIAVKTLRYLLETMETIPRGLPAPSILRRLQSALGEAHDRDVIAAGIAALDPVAKLRTPMRQALRQLKREKSSRLSCAKSCWKPLLKVSPPP
ncbi:MAG: CHAD domain-containing protein [Elusimicrobia bacterium]|nr:CHAD domain-containing protein [Elusimicrobiota bacterium]